MKTNKAHIQESQRTSTSIFFFKGKTGYQKKRHNIVTLLKKILKTDGEKRNITFRRRKPSENLKYHHLHNLISK